MLGFDPGRSGLTCLTVVHALELGMLDQCDLQLYKQTSVARNNENAKENADRYSKLFEIKNDRIYTFTGALKMQDWKMTDHIAGVENGGPM